MFDKSGLFLGYAHEEDLFEALKDLPVTKSDQKYYEDRYRGLDLKLASCVLEKRKTMATSPPKNTDSENKSDSSLDGVSSTGGKSDSSSETKISLEE